MKSRAAPLLALFGPTDVAHGCPFIHENRTRPWGQCQQPDRHERSATSRRARSFHPLLLCSLLELDVGNTDDFGIAGGVGGECLLELRG